jgi:hypothetical protein
MNAKEPSIYSKFGPVLRAIKEAAPGPAANPSPAPAEAPRRGRPAGKRSDPDYVQVTAYVSGRLHHNVKIALLQERKGREFSQLIEALLSDWLESRT